MCARYYDPTTAQFLSVDPDVATTLSPYGYVYGDPLNASDPTGLGCSAAPWDWGSCVADAWNSTGGQAVNFLQTGTVGLCVNGSIFGGFGVEGSACIVESHGFQHMGLTGSFGGGFGLGGSLSGGVEFSNAESPQDLKGPFFGGGGGFGPVAGEVQFGQNSCGQLIGVGYIGLGASTPQGYVNGTQTYIWQWW